VTHPRCSTPDEIRERIARLPRLQLAALPTPLQPCPRLSEELGVDLWVKRDDLTGLAFGGNKTRHFEFIFAEARRQGASVVLTGASSQSNFCRQASAAAARLGMKMDLTLLHGVKGSRPRGNLLLDHLLGANVEVLDNDDWHGLQAVFESKAEQYRRQGETPFILNITGPLCALGAVAYVEAFMELEEQCEAVDLKPTALFFAAVNMTPAGLALGAKLCGSRTVIQGFAPIIWPEPRQPDIAHIATQTAALLGLDMVIDPREIRNDAAYAGPDYGVPGERTMQAIRLAATMDGLLLDPVYTGKAFAGMLDYIATGRVRPGESIVFWHTGGLPALFAYDDEIMGRDGHACQSQSEL